MMPRKRLREKDVEVVRAADKRTFDEWRKTRTYLSLLCTFYVLLAAFAATVAFYLVPIDYPDDDATTCTVTETRTFTDGEKIASAYVEKVECNPRALPTWILGAGPALVGAPLLALTLLRPGRVELELNIPGGEGSAALRAGSSVQDLMRDVRDDSDSLLENFPDKD